MTLRMNGTDSIKNMWAVQRITISATTRDYRYSIDSPDSSLLRFVTSIINNVIE